VTTLHDVGGGLGTAFGHFSFRLLQFHGHGTWLMCEVALNHSFIVGGLFGLLYQTTKSAIN
jgi:hypothetical protein